MSASGTANGVFEVLITRWGEPFARLPVDGPSLLVGSEADCQVNLPDFEIPAHYGRLNMGDNEWVLDIFDADPPTRVNGALVGDSARIKVGDEVQVGAFTLTIQAPVSVGGSSDAAPLPVVSMPLESRVRVGPAEPAAPSPGEPSEMPAFPSPANVPSPVVGDYPPIMPDTEGGRSAARPLMPGRGSAIRSAELVALSDPGDGLVALPAGTIKRKHSDPVTLDGEQGEQLVKIARFLSSVNDFDGLMRVWHRAARKVLHGSTSWIGLRSDASGPLEIEGAMNPAREPCTAPDWSTTLRNTCLLRHQSLLMPDAGQEGVGSVMIAPLMTTHGAVGMAYVSTSADSDAPFTPRDLEFFRIICQLFGTQAAWAARAERSQATGGQATPDGTDESMVATVEEAASAVDNSGDTPVERSHAFEPPMTLAQSEATQVMQSLMDKLEVPNADKVSTAFKIIRGTVGLSDVLDIGSTRTGRIAVFVGSFLGETPAGPILLSQARAAFRLGISYRLKPASVLTGLNDLVYKETDGRWQMLAALVYLEPDTGRMLYAHGGPIGLRIMPVKGESRQLRHGQQPPLGEMPNIKYRNFDERLEHGEMLAVFTNSLADAVNPTGAAYGRRRLVEQLAGHATKSMDEMLRGVLQRIREFLGEGALRRDFTISLLRRDKE